MTSRLVKDSIEEARREAREAKLDLVLIIEYTRVRDS